MGDRNGPEHANSTTKLLLSMPASQSETINTPRLHFIRSGTRLLRFLIKRLSKDSLYGEMRSYIDAIDFGIDWSAMSYSKFRERRRS